MVRRKIRVRVRTKITLYATNNRDVVNPHLI